MDIIKILSVYIKNKYVDEYISKRAQKQIEEFPMAKDGIILEINKRSVEL